MDVSYPRKQEEEESNCKNSIDTVGNIYDKKARSGYRRLLASLLSLWRKWLQAAGRKIAMILLKSIDKGRAIRAVTKELLWPSHNVDCQSFHRRVTSTEIRQMKIARFFFHSCSLIPVMLYYFYDNNRNSLDGRNNNDDGRSSSVKKFPATISFTIREGIPKYAQLRCGSRDGRAWGKTFCANTDRVDCARSLRKCLRRVL